MLNCDICKTDGHYKLKCIDKGLWACPQCSGKRFESPSGGVGITSKIKLGNTWVTKRQLDETERRVILPYSAPDGGHYIGRRMENGKVSENRQPDYRS